jgi:hypothetical protein
MFIGLTFSLSVFLSFYLFVCLFLSLCRCRNLGRRIKILTVSSVSLSVFLGIYLCLSICFSMDLYLSFHLSLSLPFYFKLCFSHVCLSLNYPPLSLCLSVSLPLCLYLSVCQFFFICHIILIDDEHPIVSRSVFLELSLFVFLS